MNPNNLRLNINASTLDVPVSGILHQSATSAIEYGCHENVAENVHGECEISLDFLERRESRAVGPERRDGRPSLHLIIPEPVHRYRTLGTPSPSTCSTSCSSTTPMSNLMDHTPCSSCSSSGSDDLPLLSVLIGISQSDEDIVVSSHGYKIDCEIARTLQGTLFKAHVTSPTPQNSTYGPVGSQVTIKRVEKAVYAEKEANVDGFTFLTEQDLLKEAILLKHLTQHNRPTGDYIARFVDFFESSTHYFLVTEYVEGMNLAQFVREAFSLMTQGRLSRIDYQKTVKYLFWQMVTTMRWLHDVCHTCHLDLNPANIMLSNAEFVPEYDGSVRVKPSAAISIKLLDFGVAERFTCSASGSATKQQEQRPRKSAKDSDFLCDKGCDKGAQYCCPEIIDGISYSAKAADCWSLGMILFEMLTGTELYSAEDLWDNAQNGFAALKDDCLREYLAQQYLIRCFKRDTLNIVEGLLRYDEEQRLSAGDVIAHPWFRSYFERYNASMQKKNALDAMRLEKQAEMLRHSVPCYERVHYEV